MEELAIYNCKFVYVKGNKNTVADALSRYPHKFENNLNDTERNACHPCEFSMDDKVVAALENRQPMMNCVNALSASAPLTSIKSELKISKELIEEMKNTYKTDMWCQKLLSASKGMPALKNKRWIMVY